LKSSQPKFYLQFVVIVSILFGSLPTKTSAQNRTIQGNLTDAKGFPVVNALITVENTQISTLSDKNGGYVISFPSNQKIVLKIKHLGFKEKRIPLNVSEMNAQPLSIELEEEVFQMNQVNVNASNADRSEAGLLMLNPKNVQLLPSAFGDFNKVIALLPGVVSNNELSSTYSVRGGNYDENLIYVNGIEVYRPQLVRAGQQEGLSFVNPQLASSVAFSSGGWQSKYGDKLSSVMNVDYKTPQKFEASAIAGLLGGSFHLGTRNKSERISFIMGYRNKTATYLLNTLPTQGQYLPSFNDVQTYIQFDLTDRKKEFVHEKRTTLAVLSSYANNRYSVIPKTQQSTFGTATEILSLTIGFDGTQVMNYDTWQNGWKLSHWVSSKLKTEWYASAVDSREREFVDMQAGYRLCDVNPDPSGAANFTKCATERGVDSLFEYGRNTLHTQILGLETRNYWQLNPKNTLQFGLKYSKETFTDVFYEYGLNDSLGYTTLTYARIKNNELATNRFSGYIQNTMVIDSNKTLTVGVRIGYWDLNKQFLISPSIQYSQNAFLHKDLSFKAALGIYRQPPFYRELRDFQGNINPNLKAQSSVHVVAGTDYRFKAWNRSFKFSSELYLKYLWEVVPYDIDNTRIRYYATNSAVAYATGLDMRVSGEFIKGDESWFSLGIMQTKENISNQGWVRRPTDQFITFGCFFQDHLPKRPSVKVYLSLIYGSGLPFGIPNNEQYRAAFSMPSYKRLDIGFNKVLSFNQKNSLSKKISLKSLIIGVEVLNILGVDNVLSYIWVADYSNRQFAVPNTLSQRFLNFKINIQL
jgi:hypothetical protein